MTHLGNRPVEQTDTVFQIVFDPSP